MAWGTLRESKIFPFYRIGKGRNSFLDKQTDLASTYTSSAEILTFSLVYENITQNFEQNHLI